MSKLWIGIYSFDIKMCTFAKTIFFIKHFIVDVHILDSSLRVNIKCTSNPVSIYTAGSTNQRAGASCKFPFSHSYSTPPRGPQKHCVHLIKKEGNSSVARETIWAIYNLQRELQPCCIVYSKSTNVSKSLSSLMRHLFLKGLLIKMEEIHKNV